MKRYIYFLILAFFYSTLSLAQDSDEKKLSDYYIDLSVPDLGISGLMDITSENILKPANFSEVAWQVYNDLENMTGTAYGLELPLVRKKKRNLDYYQSHTFRMNTRFSAGIRNSEEGLSFAFGVKFNIYNKADPYANNSLTSKMSDLLDAQLKGTEKTDTDYTRAMGKANTFFNAEGDTYDAIWELYGIDKKKLVTPEQRNDLWDKIQSSGFSKDDFLAIHNTFNAKLLATNQSNEELRKSLSDLKTEFSAKNWNAGFLTMTNGILVNAADARISSVTPKKWQSVMAWGQPVFEECSQLVLNAQFTGNVGGSTLAIDANSDPALDQRNKLFLGGRWLFKTNKVDKLVTGNVFVEGGYTETSFYSRDLEKVFVGLVGAEFRVMERFWIQGGVGVSNDEGKFQFSLKQNIGEKSRF